MTLLAVYGSAALACIASALVGQAVLAASGWRNWSWLAPPVGLSVLLSIAAAVARLPGRATTALVLIVLVVAVSAAYLRGRVTGLAASVRIGLPVLGLTMLLVSLPFLFSGRVGVLGTLVLSDFSEQLSIADWLRTEIGTEPGKIASGYPLGPQCLAAAMTGAGAGPARATLTGLMLAVPILTALTALSALARLPGWRRLIGATLVGIPYLGAAFMLQSGFKETIFGLILLAFALMLAEGRTHFQARSDRPGRVPAPLGLLAGGAVATFGPPALAWLAAVLGCWVLAEAIARRRATPVERTATLRGLLGGLRTGGAIALIAIGPQVMGAAGFGGSDTVQGGFTGYQYLGNLVEPLPVWEVFGVWPSPDYRFAPGGWLGEPLSALLGLAGFAFGGVWWARRRRLAAPAALVACLVIFAASALKTDPFLQAKALAVAAPLAMLVALGALLATAEPGTSGRARRTAIAKALLAVAFICGAAFSSYLALQGAEVDTADREGELDAFGRLVEGHTVLYLIADRVFPAYVLGYGRPVAVEGRPSDFDAVRPQTLSQIDFVVTTRTAYQSAAPGGFHRVRATRSFVLWQRRGEVALRRDLDRAGDPGAPLGCDGFDRSLLDRPRAAAAIFPVPPRVGGPSAWVPLSGGADPGGFRQRLRLPRGDWELSLQYYSQVPLRVSAPGIDLTLPPVTSLIGPWWRVATLQSDGRPAEITVRRGERSTLAGILGRRFGPKIPEWVVGRLAAVSPGSRRIVPLRAACGRYVDWYRAPSPRSRQ